MIKYVFFSLNILIRYGSRKVLFITLYCCRNTRCIEFGNDVNFFTYMYDVRKKLRQLF